MREFTFKESDKEGAETLDSVSSAPLFNKWMFETIQPFCKGRILEIGSGTGNISSFFLDQGRDLVLSDIRKEYCDKLIEKFPAHKENIFLIDLANPEFTEAYPQFLEKFDTVFALNVVEHIKEDGQALANCKKLLKPGGRVVILVPAFEMLYNSLDHELCHYRRYTKGSLKSLLIKQDFEVQKTFYFNVMGIAGWLFSGKIMKEKTLSKGKMSLYNKLMPFNRLLDKLTFNQIGLSVISIGIKK